MDSFKGDLFWGWQERDQRLIVILKKKKRKKSYGLLLTLLPKQPLGTPTTFFSTAVWPTLPPHPYTPTFLFFRRTDWALHWHTFLGDKRTPVYTFQMTYLSLTTLHSPSCTMTRLWRRPTSRAGPTEQLHMVSGKKKQTPVFMRDWTNNVASLLTYCSICWLGNNLTSSIKQFKERGIYAFKGSFRCHFSSWVPVKWRQNKKKNILSTWETKS